MSRKKRKNRYRKMDQENTQPVEPQQTAAEETTQPEPEAAQQAASEAQPEPDKTDKVAELEAALAKEKKEYLFLMADFDNFRKRTLKEKSELIRNGAESAMKGLLPIVDDFERGLAAIKDSADAEAVKEGMELIYNKFVKYLEQNGVKAMESTGADFNDELHEAVALVPGPEEMKNKVIDTVQKGYMLNDKVLRHAKVAVGQ